MGMTVSVQNLANGQESIYEVATAWTELYINATNNETMQQSLCMNQMKQYGANSDRALVGTTSMSNIVTSSKVKQKILQRFIRHMSLIYF